MWQKNFVGFKTAAAHIVSSLIRCLLGQLNYNAPYWLKMKRVGALLTQKSLYLIVNFWLCDKFGLISQNRKELGSVFNVLLVHVNFCKEINLIFLFISIKTGQGLLSLFPPFLLRPWHPRQGLSCWACWQSRASDSPTACPLAEQAGTRTLSRVKRSKQLMWSFIWKKVITL